MTQAAVDIVGPRLTGGMVAVPRVSAAAPGGVTFIEGGHPQPTSGSLAAGHAVANLLAQTSERDLVLCLISGGGSALLELPHAGLSLADLRLTTEALLKCGATIHEVNTVRTHLSQLKGGGLARLAAPARVLALILSDVVGNDLSVIASGLTVPATTQPRDALRVIDKYGLRATLPQSVLRHLAASGQAPETDVSVENRLIGSNRLAGAAAAVEAQRLGFSAELVADDWQGEARAVGKRFAALTAASKQKPRCLIVGGEATVTVRGRGQGGRNTEAALAAALAIDGLPHVVISTFATDGVDGPTDAAGAVARGDTGARARALGLDPQRFLDDNDSYSLFAALHDLIRTGPTGTNVNDLMFGLVY